MDDAGEIRPKDAGEELLERYPSSLNDAGEFEALLAGFATVAFFNDKKTEIYARQDHKLRLAASPQYPDFAYDGSLVEVNPFIQLTADCAPPERIRNTLDALKEQFKK